MVFRIAAILLVLSTPAAAFESRLLDSTGKAIPFAQISIVDQRGRARTDADGRFTLTPDPELPATLIVVGSRGELFPPVTIASARAEIRIAAAFRESVTITLGAAPNIEGTPASAPVVIGAEELEQLKPSRVAEAIAVTPGVSIRGEGPPAVPVVRGLAGGRTLLLIDDARIVAERRAGPSATFVDPLTLGSIEISRGPGSVAYGSDAIGGVVHLRPRDPVPGQPGFRYDTWMSFGGRTGRAIAAESSSDAFGGAVLAAVHASASDDEKDASGAAIENSQYRDRGAMLRFVRDSSWGRIRTGLMTSVARDVGAPSTDPALTIYPDERASLLTFAADMQQRGSWSSATVRASLGGYSITTDRVRATGIESAAVKARDASLRLSGERAGQRSRLVAGIDVVSRFGLRASGSIDDASRRDAGAWGAWSGEVARWMQLASGARADYVTTRNRGGWFGDHARSDVALSGYGALTSGPFRRVTTTLQLASGYREPSLSDRYYRGVSGRGFVIGNPDLEPERSVQLDAGVRWNGVRSRVALFAYDYRIRNLVERYRSGSDFFFRNRGEGEIRGLEAEAMTPVRPNIELQLGAALASGRDLGSGDSLDDIAPPTLHASLRWASARASAFVTAAAYARDRHPGPVEAPRPGYAELDLGAGWRLSPLLELRLVLRNATNAKHFGSSDAAAAQAPGRSMLIGINR